MVTYEQWNRAIISYFFEDCEHGEKVFLHTTPDTLPEIAKHAGFDVVDAEESLKDAVRKKVIINRVIPTDEIWLRRISPADKEHPHVAFLALCVLAAYNMGTSEEVFHTNYYVPLNILLFDKPNEGIPKGLKYQEWEEFWIYLQDWVKDKHDVELYLTQGPRNRKYVWYPISQCLISNRDRRNIYRFFHHLNLTPFSNVQDEKLEEDLHAWLLSSSGSAKIERYFSKETYKQSILNQVKSLLEHWDGDIPPEPIQGQKQFSSPIRVELRINQIGDAEIRYWFPRRGRNETACITNQLGLKTLQTNNSEKWFQSVTDNNNSFWNLPNLLQLQTNEIKPITYTLHRSDIWVFRKNSECDNGWISQRNMELYEEHCILFHKRLINQVTACLKLTCGEEVEEPKRIYVNEEPNDWFRLQVTPTTLKRFTDPELWRLTVDSNKQICFIGGLSVKGEDGHRAYLDICLPSISVPDLGNTNDLSLQIGEHAFPVGEDRIVRLENTLGVGSHKLSYGKKTSELRIIAPEHSLEDQEKTLTVALSEDKETIPIYSEETTAEITEKSGVWVAGAKFFGTDIPKTTWEEVAEVPVEPLPPKNDKKVPAQLISSVVKLAIELKNNSVSVPEWFDETIQYLDENVAMRTLVQKKLQDYHETALSYDDLRKRGGE